MTLTVHIIAIPFFVFLVFLLVKVSQHNKRNDKLIAKSVSALKDCRGYINFLERDFYLKLKKQENSQ